MSSFDFHAPPGGPLTLDTLLEAMGGRAADERHAAAAVYESLAKRDTRKQTVGDSCLAQGVSLALIALALDLEGQIVLAALVLPFQKNGGLAASELRACVGEGAATLVAGVVRLEEVRRQPARPRDEARLADYVHGVRQLLLATAQDVRVVLLSLMDRLRRLQQVDELPPAEAEPLARAVLEIDAPLANRLGIWQLKWPLEDLAFRCLQPDTYHHLAKQLQEKRAERERYIADLVVFLRQELTAADVPAEISGRPKHIYSIWRKMCRKDVGFEEIFDARAVRVLVDDVTACYTALGVVHGLWRHIPREFDDYIANPKANGYQSLHTAVVGPEGKSLEVQIRSRAMHQYAEYGVAAHWRYKEQTAGPTNGQEGAWAEQLLAADDRDDSAVSLVERFRSELSEDRVYVLSPKGEVVDMPRGATVLDFAYHIHTQVGHRCRGAKVNGRMVPLAHVLKTGERVEILTAREGGPGRDWLNPQLGFLQTARARGQVRRWFAQREREQNLAEGRRVLERELQRLGLTEVDLAPALQRGRWRTRDDLYIAVGAGEVAVAQVVEALQPRVLPEETPEQLVRRPTRSAEDAGEGIQVQGVGDLLVHTARCCKPAPPDPIIGYITRGHGVTVHRADCPEVLRLQHRESTRLIETSWAAADTAVYPTDIQLEAYDRSGLLRDVTMVLADEDVNVVNVQSASDRRSHRAHLRMTVEVRDVGQLSRILGRLSQLPNVVQARRAI